MLQLEDLGGRGGASGPPSQRRRACAVCCRRCIGRRADGVAVLVDEYDKPILDALVQKPEVARQPRLPARAVRSDQGQRRARGVHVPDRHQQVLEGEPLSQLNDLTDLTLDPVYSSICGYTEGDLDTVFTPELGGLDREQVREWRLVRTMSASG